MTCVMGSGVTIRVLMRYKTWVGCGRAARVLAVPRTGTKGPQHRTKCRTHLFTPAMFGFELQMCILSNLISFRSKEILDIKDILSRSTYDIVLYFSRIIIEN